MYRTHYLHPHFARPLFLSSVTLSNTSPLFLDFPYLTLDVLAFFSVCTWKWTITVSYPCSWLTTAHGEPPPKSLIAIWAKMWADRLRQWKTAHSFSIFCHFHPRFRNLRHFFFAVGNATFWICVHQLFHFALHCPLQPPALTCYAYQTSFCVSYHHYNRIVSYTSMSSYLSSFLMSFCWTYSCVEELMSCSMPTNSYLVSWSIFVILMCVSILLFQCRSICLTFNASRPHFKADIQSLLSFYLTLEISAHRCKYLL